MKEAKRARSRQSILLLLVYGVAALHVIVIFTVGEPYPSLQGPLFAGHLQKERTIYVPFHRENDSRDRLPSHQRLLRHETLGVPAQRDFNKLAPSFSGLSARQFLIGHSLRSPVLPAEQERRVWQVEWSAYKFHAPLDGPPERIGEEDVLHD